MGRENDSGACSTCSRAGAGASPDGGPATSALLVLSFTSSGGSVNLLALQGACAVPGEEGGGRREEVTAPPDGEERRVLDPGALGAGRRAFCEGRGKDGRGGETATLGGNSASAPRRGGQGLWARPWRWQP